MPESENAAMKPNDEFPTHRHDGDLPRELKSVESRLAALSPRDDRLDRERLMFLAGQASVEPANWHGARSRGRRFDSRAWPAGFAGMSAVAAALAAMLFLRADHAAQFPQTDVVQTEVTRFRRPVSSDHPILTTRDAHLGNIDLLLAQTEGFRPDAAEPASTSAEDDSIPILTPARWPDVLN